MAVSSTTAIVNCPPQDMIYEIFSRCDINTLDVLKAVSKDFKNLVYDPSFIDAYYSKKDNIYGYLLQVKICLKYKQSFISINESDNGLTFPPREFKTKFDDIQIVGSSLQGIVCCVVRYNRMYRFYAGKPTTEQWQPLPNPKTRNFNALLGFDRIGFADLRSKPLRFTIIRLSISRKGFCRRLHGYECYRREVFDSKRWSWKELDDVLLPEETYLDNRPAVHASGHISWITYKGDVLSLETNGEKHRIFAMPEAALDAHYKRIIEYEGKLGYVFNTKECKHIEVWVLADWESGLWRRVHAGGVQWPAGTMAPPSSVETFYSSDVALLLKPDRAMCRMKSLSYKEVDIGVGIGVDYDQIFPFRSDYEPVSFKGNY